MSSGRTPANCSAVARLIGRPLGAGVLVPPRGKPALAGPGIGSGAGGLSRVESIAAGEPGGGADMVDGGRAGGVGGSCPDAPRPAITPAPRAHASIQLGRILTSCLGEHPRPP